MASICSSATPFSATIISKSGTRSNAFRASTPSIAGLPSIQRRSCRVVCSAERREMGDIAAPLMAAATTAALSLAENNVAMGLVDDGRMTTEGTGLGLGLSDPLLAWILLGGFGLIWALYASTYTVVQEDEDSGLSL